MLRIPELKQNAIDSTLFKIVDTYKYHIFFIIISLMAILIRIRFFNFRSDDYRDFFKWISHFKKNNGIFGIKNIESIYSMPYLYFLAFISYFKMEPLYLIKIFLTIIDFLGAFACYLISKNICEKKWGISEKTKIFSSIVFALVLFNPMVILNSSAWMQCDMVYSSFCIYSLYFLMKKKYSYAFLLFSLGFTFKIQAIFIFPLFVFLYFKNKDFSIKNFIIVPLVFFISGIPAILFGRSFIETYNPFFTQMTMGSSVLAINFPSIYNIFPSISNFVIFKNPDLIKLPLRFAGIIFTAMIIGCFFLFLLNEKIEIDSKIIVNMAFILILICTFFLPGIHDRYMFIVDTLSIVFFLINKNVLILIGTNIISLNSYIAYFSADIPITLENSIFYYPIPLKICTFLELFIVVYTSYIFIKEIAYKCNLYEKK